MGFTAVGPWGPAAPKGFRLGAFGRYSTLEISDFALPEILGSIDFIYMLGKLARGGISSKEMPKDPFT